MKKLRILLTSLFASIALLGIAAPAYAATDVLNSSACGKDVCNACSVTGAAESSACHNNGSDPIAGADGILAKVTKIVSYLSGAAAIILIIISGFMYVSSDGDAGRVQSARTTLVYAVIGIVIVLMSQGIIMFVLNRV
jgi:hypothetical protein